MARTRLPAALAALLGVLVAGLDPTFAGGEIEVLHVVVDREGLPALHEEQEDGPPVMRLPQFRLFDADGRPLWTFTRMLMKRKDFRLELERRIADRQPLAEGRTLRQEARHFLRRGGLPLNLTTLRPSELTIVEYWTADCGQCDLLSNEVDRYFERAEGPPVLIIRALVEELR